MMHLLTTLVACEMCLAWKWIKLWLVPRKYNYCKSSKSMILTIWSSQYRKGTKTSPNYLLNKRMMSGLSIFWTCHPWNPWNNSLQHFVDTLWEHKCWKYGDDHIAIIQMTKKSVVQLLWPAEGCDSRAIRLIVYFSADRRASICFPRWASFQTPAVKQAGPDLWPVLSGHGNTATLSQWWRAIVIYLSSYCMCQSDMSGSDCYILTRSVSE